MCHPFKNKPNHCDGPTREREPLEDVVVVVVVVVVKKDVFFKEMQR
jgi:hypothetical protein